MKILRIFSRQRPLQSRMAAAWLLLCLVACLLAPWLASDRPWYVRYHDETYFPCFLPGEQLTLAVPGVQGLVRAGQVDWKKVPGATCLWPPVSYRPGSPDLLNAGFVSPFGEQKFKTAEGEIVPMPLRYRHWLGTTETGNDVFSGILHGTLVSLGIGFFSLLIAALIGIPLGAFSGYAGDRGFRMRRIVFWMLLAGLVPAAFYGFELRSTVLHSSFRSGGLSWIPALLISVLIALMVMSVFFWTGRALSRLRGWKGEMTIPVDLLLSRTTELFATLPRLVLIVTLSALMRPSVVNLVLILGLTSWTDLARLVRAETLKVRSSDYLQAAVGSGISTRRIVLSHVLPNVLPPVFAAMLPAVAGMILAESALSFLGIGVPFDTVTWGSLMASAKGSFDAWWVVVFPGLAIFFTLASLNVLANEIRNRK